MVSPEHLQNYLETHIPISKAMGVKVCDITPESLTLRVPLAPNINHKSTVFGGSLHSAATLACWGMVYSILYPYLEEFDGKCPEIVIASSSVSYLKPVTDDFTVTCQAPSNEMWEKVMKMLEKHEKARIRLSADIYHNDEKAFVFEGGFAVLVGV